MAESTASPKIVWTESIRVGIRELDDDHKRFIDLVNDLGQAAASDGIHAEVSALADAIRIDARRHFEREEDVLLRFGYPGFETHRREHEILILHLGVLLDRIVAEVGHEQIRDHANAIKVALVNHLILCDMKYKSFLLDAQGR